MSKDVVIYGNPECGSCRAAKSWFEERGIQHNWRDIKADPVAGQEAQAMGKGTLPVIVIDGKKLAGFEPSQVEEQLQN